MKCHYFEEEGHRLICKAKGITPPTVTELRLYCYISPYNCPTYKRHVEKIADNSLEMQSKKMWERESEKSVKFQIDEGLI